MEVVIYIDRHHKLTRNIGNSFTLSEFENGNWFPCYTGNYKNMLKLLNEYNLNRIISVF